MSLAQTTEEPQEVPRTVSIVDCDIHPTLTMPQLLKRLSGRWRRHLEQLRL